jgi:asparagine synthase (glutamine-hydrolysing)
VSLQQQGTQLQIHGYCLATPEQILAQRTTQGSQSLVRLAGNFVLVFTDGESTELVSSAHGAWNYFYAIVNGQLHHGDTVTDVLKSAGLAWQWNVDALAEVIFGDHPTADDTLHPEVCRLPAATVLRFQDHVATLETARWDELHPAGPATPEAALNTLNADVAALSAVRQPVLSMSGGFDSRLLLSSMLRQGIRPRLLTLGFADSDDYVVASQIARDLSLEQERIELEAADFLQHAERIAQLTNGCKPAFHWHTYLYARKSSMTADDLHFIGSNGEFARSFLLDKGIAGQLAGAIAPATVLRKFWSAKLRSPFTGDEVRQFSEPLAARLNDKADIVARRSALCPGGLLPGLDIFYLRQRVRQFIANGIKLYADTSHPITPMLHLDWTRQVWNLPRKWKFGSNWHRFGIVRNYPKLADYPLEAGGQPMEKAAPPFYWRHGGHAGHSGVSYERYNEWFADPKVLEYIRGQADLLEGLIPRSLVMSMCDQHQRDRSRKPAMGILLMLTAWTRVIRDALG